MTFAEFTLGQAGICFDNVVFSYLLIQLTNAIYSNVEFRKVQPIDYKLFQVADLLCTMELLSLKAEAFSKSERDFFHSVREFKKNYLKPLLRKKL